MFSAIDGGFQFIIKGLFTMDLSWLFMFGASTSAHIVLAIAKVRSHLKNKEVEAKIEEAKQQ